MVHIDIAHFEIPDPGFPPCEPSDTVIVEDIEADLDFVPGRSNNSCVWRHEYDPPLLLTTIEGNWGAGCSGEFRRRFWLMEIELRYYNGTLPTDGPTVASNVPVVRCRIGHAIALSTTPPSSPTSTDHYPGYPASILTWGYKACGGGGSGSIPGDYERDIVGGAYFEAEVTVPP